MDRLAKRFPELIQWVSQFSLEIWTQHCDEGRRLIDGSHDHQHGKRKVSYVGLLWGAKPSGRDFRKEPSEGTQDEKTPHPTQNLKLLHHISSICPSHRRTIRGTRRSNNLVEKTFDASHKYSLKLGRSTIGFDTTCWATVGSKTIGERL
ncbi:hypothetical protein PIB30_022136 [Stylosanthes scabra]|uniref:Uncharacterized protein n=1 Tax=Stylosanthes scabra TaxID=79078 RepID=A0ABU6U8B9_9FABA|nr:hypothetical protein [Stylosanthes scabra]